MPPLPIAWGVAERLTFCCCLLRSRGIARDGPLPLPEAASLDACIRCCRLLLPKEASPDAFPAVAWRDVARCLLRLPLLVAEASLDTSLLRIPARRRCSALVLLLRADKAALTCVWRCSSLENPSLDAFLCCCYCLNKDVV